MNSGSELVLMSRERISRSLKRMAHEIAEHNVDDAPIDLFGIDERGYAVAQALEDILNPIFNDEVRLIQLTLEEKNSQSTLEDIELQKNHYPVIVDDVIFSGKTMFKALKIISNHIKPSEIHTAVLVDRGHRKFPIKAEFYGMELPTKLDEHVSVVVENKQLQNVKLIKS
ncbi:phosphoribosyltransferase family protein [Fodinibius sp.]|uniref:phosphoribosyltransferase family protein n=1 Tax=Fodinibius sp. TaxID=1872440 RepID=UPI002ACED121|nr:phosphoribosyltransferase family protein [Fodinibius sp.]MDZ7658595.1 phosphoribosyltransferase family protein [Fodinibius sp.]